MRDFSYVAHLTSVGDVEAFQHRWQMDIKIFLINIGWLVSLDLRFPDVRFFKIWSLQKSALSRREIISLSVGKPTRSPAKRKGTRILVGLELTMKVTFYVGPIIADDESKLQQINKNKNKKSPDSRDVTGDTTIHCA